MERVILVVEDEPTVRDMLAQMLTEVNYDTRLAATAAGAVEMAEDERPDAVLLDINLPDASGTLTLNILRSMRPDVPIIMVTANADEEVARETLKRGAFDYVTKPFGMDRLTSVLEAALDYKGTATGHPPAPH
jgi:DNA-binding response OmpR family regulator